MAINNQNNKLVLAGTAALIAEPLLVGVMHAGGVGAIVGLAVGGATYILADEQEKKAGKEGRVAPPSLPLPEITTSKLANLGYRIVRGKSACEQREQDEPQTEKLPDTDRLPEETLFDFDEDDEIKPVSRKSDVFCFSELLASGFVPTINKIFVGRTMDGKDIFVAAKDLCHVALAGKTGGGKGSLMRLIMAQLCYVGAKVLLLNPHYMKWVVADAGKEFDEDWTPFEGINPRKIDHKTGQPRTYLEQPPIKYTANYASIGEALAWTRNLLHKRMVEGGEGGKSFVPYFIVLDEWPAIAKKVKDGPDILSDLLREGRKFGIFVIVASQDFQVKTIGMDGGSVRDCLLTTFYTGGDKVTGRSLLHYEDGKSFPENELGKGVVALRCKGTDNEPILVRVPFVDNEAVYKLLGPSTFKKADPVSVQHEKNVEPQIDWSKNEDQQALPMSTMPVRNLDSAQQEQTITLTYADLMALVAGNRSGNDAGFVSRQGNQEMPGNACGNGAEMASQAGSGKIIDDVFPVSRQSGTEPLPRSEVQIPPVSGEILEAIRNMKASGFKDGEIARIVSLRGRKYVIYQQCLAYLGYRQEEAK